MSSQAKVERKDPSWRVIRPSMRAIVTEHDLLEQGTADPDICRKIGEGGGMDVAILTASLIIPATLEASS